MEREIINFNAEWLYISEDIPNARLKNIDESCFKKVAVPHANTVLTAHKGENFQSQIDSYRFVSWYRRHFTLDEKYSDKRLILEFEGVATVADVYVNGEYIGQHKGAYTGFSFDITESVKCGEDNVIAVRVDSTRHTDIPPEGENVDYCLFGGIVRNVSLKVLEAMYVDNAFITTPDLSAEKGCIEAEITVINKGEATHGIVEALLLDADGNEVLITRSEERLIKEICTFKIKSEYIENPHLWDIDDPYLYSVKISVLENGSVTDTYETKIGFRWFEFRNKEGDARFYLNGRKIVLRGVNRHEQWPWQGRAIPDKLQMRDADMIKYTGMNSVRCSHYPQSPSFLARCDEIGLIVLEEAPGWQHIGDEAWKEIYMQNIREMILRDRNHPSIVTWGVRVNESWDDNALYSRTTALAKQLDATRPTHGVRRMENYDSTENIEDLFCVNYQYPEKPRFTPFIITEHSMDWYDGHGFSWASNADTMKFTKSFADAVNYYYGNELCAGGFAWSMFDYDNEVNYTKTGNVFYSGLYDIFRLPKDVSYFYRAQKNTCDEIVLYIANYWTEDAPSEVQIYSNCDKVELFVNGISKGCIEPNLYTNIPHPVFSFANIKYEAGELEAVGYIGGNEVARTINKTPGNAEKLVLTPDYDTLVADGTDMTLVTVTIVDENGTRLPHASNVVNISIDGVGEFIGEKTIELEAGRTAFIVKAKYLEPGSVTCTAKSSGLADGKCVIYVKS